MPRYNDKIELSIEDMDLIEDALRRSKRALFEKSMSSDEPAETSDGQPCELDQTMRQIHDLLGRLHNQKVFYRPSTGAYVGG